MSAIQSELKPKSDPKEDRLNFYLTKEARRLWSKSEVYVPLKDRQSNTKRFTYILRCFCEDHSLTITGIFEDTGIVEKRRIRGKWVVHHKDAVGHQLPAPLVVVDDELKRAANELGAHFSEFSELSEEFDWYASARSDKGAWIILRWKRVGREEWGFPEAYRPLPHVAVYNTEVELLNAFASKGIRHIAQDLIGSQLQETDWNI